MFLFLSLIFFSFFSSANFSGGSLPNSNSRLSFSNIPDFSSNYSLYVNPIHKITPEQLKEIIENDLKNDKYKNNNKTIMIVFEDKKQEEELKKILSDIAENNNKNKTSLTFEYIQKKHIQKKQVKNKIESLQDKQSNSTDTQKNNRNENISKNLTFVYLLHQETDFNPKEFSEFYTQISKNEKLTISRIFLFNSIPLLKQNIQKSNSGYYYIEKLFNNINYHVYSYKSLNFQTSSLFTLLKNTVKDFLSFSKINSDLISIYRTKVPGDIVQGKDFEKIFNESLNCITDTDIKIESLLFNNNNTPKKGIFFVSTHEEALSLKILIHELFQSKKNNIGYNIDRIYIRTTESTIRKDGSNSTTIEDPVKALHEDQIDILIVCRFLDNYPDSNNYLKKVDYMFSFVRQPTITSFLKRFLILLKSIKKNPTTKRDIFILTPINTEKSGIEEDILENFLSNFNFNNPDKNEKTTGQDKPIKDDQTQALIKENPTTDIEGVVNFDMNKINSHAPDTSNSDTSMSSKVKVIVAPKIESIEQTYKSFIDDFNKKFTMLKNSPVALPKQKMLVIITQFIEGFIRNSSEKSMLELEKLSNESNSIEKKGKEISKKILNMLTSNNKTILENKFTINGEFNTVGFFEYIQSNDFNDKILSQEKNKTDIIDKILLLLVEIDKEASKTANKIKLMESYKYNIQNCINKTKKRNKDFSKIGEIFLKHLLLQHIISSFDMNHIFEIKGVYLNKDKDYTDIQSQSNAFESINRFHEYFSTLIGQENIENTLINGNVFLTKISKKISKNILNTIKDMPTEKKLIIPMLDYSNLNLSALYKDESKDDIEKARKHYELLNNFCELINANEIVINLDEIIFIIKKNKNTTTIEPAFLIDIKDNSFHEEIKKHSKFLEIIINNNKKYIKITKTLDEYYHKF